MSSLSRLLTCSVVVNLLLTFILVFNIYWSDLIQLNSVQFLKIQPRNTKSKVVEIAVISNKNSDSGKENIKRIENYFSGFHIRFSAWDIISSESDCPNALRRTDEWHSAKKVFTIGVNHLLIWQNFVAQHSNSKDSGEYIIIFEDDAQCAFENCGQVALSELR